MPSKLKNTQTFVQHINQHPFHPSGEASHFDLHKGEVLFLHSLCFLLIIGYVPSSNKKNFDYHPGDDSIYSKADALSKSRKKARQLTIIVK